MKIREIDYNIKDDICYFFVEGYSITEGSSNIGTLPGVTWIFESSSTRLKGLMIKDYSSLTLRQQTRLIAHIIEFVTDDLSVGATVKE